MVKKTIIFYIFLVLCLVPAIISANNKSIESFTGEEEIIIPKEEIDIIDEENKVNIKEKFENDSVNNNKLFIGIGITIICLSIFYFLKILIDNKFKISFSYDNLYLIISIIIGILTCGLLTSIKKGHTIALIIFSIIILIFPITLFIKDSIEKNGETETLVFIPVTWLILIIIYIKRNFSNGKENLEIPENKTKIIIKKNNYLFNYNKKKYKFISNSNIDQIKLNLDELDNKPKLEMINQNNYEIKLDENNIYNYVYRNSDRKPLKIINNDLETFYIKKIDKNKYIIKTKNNNNTLLDIIEETDQIILNYRGLTKEFILSIIIGFIILKELNKQKDMNADDYYFES
jgi:uncharacterized membrane protein YtjA (UPF0391 family)